MDERRFRTSSNRSERPRTRKSFVRLCLHPQKCNSRYHLLIRHAPSPNPPLSTLNRVVSLSPSPLDEPSISTWRPPTLKLSHASVPSTRQPKHYPTLNKPVKIKKHHALFNLNDSAISTWMVPRRNGR